MSYHSELDAAQRPSDDALAAAEKRGARAALTRLAAWAHEAGLHEMGTHTKRFQQAQYPAPRVRAVVRDYDVEWRLHGDEWKPFVGDVIPYQGEDPTRAAVAGMFEAQQRADAEGFVQGPNGKDAPAAPPPPTREWWLCVEPSGNAYAEQTRIKAEDLSERNDEIVHVRELRPLTAAQVEALAQAMADAWHVSVGVSLVKLEGSRRANYRAEARAALAHLGIPYEEDTTHA